MRETLNPKREPSAADSKHANRPPPLLNCTCTLNRASTPLTRTVHVPKKWVFEFRIITSSGAAVSCAAYDYWLSGLIKISNTVRMEKHPFAHDQKLLMQTECG